ncbi:phage tail protein [Rhodobacter sphaeroides]|uniref:phage late control D family protein n=1 Tax=Cereibacter sphaeroides TaxID=1063 RepID=UPI001326A1EB|nr:contractile injection system protein, VgrG/Pvc8 family [Cereibacter sphaeroides]MWP38060.1 phage tail protein [Cereibacter sphaeroides]
MIPAFRLTVDGEDATGAVADRLLSLVLTDEDGTRADRLEIELDDRDGRLAFPDTEARIEVALGFAGEPLAAMGVFAVDGVAGSGPRQSLRITATAADLKGEIRSPRTRAWRGRSLRDIVATIAAEAGLRPVVGESVAGTAWDYLAQTAESNLHFLTRIAATLDATAKPAGGALVVQRRGEGRTAAGDPLTPPVLPPWRLTDWSWSFEGRSVYRAAEAEWTETGSGITHRVRVGQGTPLKKLRHAYPTEAEALRAAEAVLSGAARAAMTLEARLAGFEPGLLGGASVTVTGLRPELNGEWHLESVSHQLDPGGLVTSFRGRKGTA